MSSDNCKDGASKSNNDVCEVVGKLENLKTTEDNNNSICANCGKEGSSDEINNTCNKCKQVMYCNAACKKKHRHKHKQQCEEHVRLAAERAAKLYDEKLFKQPPPNEDCPICFIQLPTLGSGSKYHSCCGKKICGGCNFAPLYDNQGNAVDDHKCPFCRTLKPISTEEAVERDKKRMEANNAESMYNFGYYYSEGMQTGLPQDHGKALDLWHRAGDLGCSKAYNSIGHAYEHGRGVEVDMKKAKQYYELAAMGGDVQARYNLAFTELKAGNLNRALKHFMIAVRSGDDKSLKEIHTLYSEFHLVKKEDYTKALQLYQSYLCEIKSKQRDEAASAREDYRYY